jgi:hypothetical protein
MNESRSRFCLELVGNRRYPRYAIVTCPGASGLVRYWTGCIEEPWSSDHRRARKWADAEMAAVALEEIVLSGPV